jgi:hypothetical protein
MTFHCCAIVNENEIGKKFTDHIPTTTDDGDDFNSKRKFTTRRNIGNAVFIGNAENNEVSDWRLAMVFAVMSLKRHNKKDSIFSKSNHNSLCQFLL